MGASPSPSPDVDISIGSVLDGRYRIDAVLGTGGMGRVYRGEHTGIGRAVAIKVLHADLNRNREAAQRFQREALASGRLDHPNIVGVSDFGILDEGPCYLVMEALEGESLGDRLDRDKRVPWQEAVEILRGVLHGLRHAHDRGVVHRDIKPDNVFLARKDGGAIVKILDFGIAKLYAGSPDDPASTRAGLTVGTPAYLSPEQAVGGEIKPASDLYSATVLLFEMVTGRPPFEDKDPLAMLGAHVSRTPPQIAEVAPELAVPPALEDVIQRGLIKASADRITSAADYLALLDGVSGARGSASHAIGNAHTDLQLSTQSGATPTSSHTPIPTPIPGALPTPAPGTLSPLTPAPANTAALATSTGLISLTDAGPLPRRWIKRSGILIGGLILVAVLLALISNRGGPNGQRPGPSSSLPPGSGNSPRTEKRSTAPAIVPIIVPGLVDPETRYKALIHDLESGKACTDRKAAIAGLVLLGDKRAIGPLRKARFRMRGGVLGLGDSNTNSCLKSDAEEAIKALGGKLR